MQPFLTDSPPAVDLAKHRALGNAGQTYPCIDSRHRTQAGQCRTFVYAAQHLPVALGATQVARQPFARRDFHVLHTQVDQLVGSEPPPKSQQQQTAVAGVAKQRRSVITSFCVADGHLQPLVYLLDDIDLKGACALFCNRVEGADAFENLTHQGRLGRVCKTMVDVPAGQCGKPLAKGADRQRGRMVGQVTGGRISGSWQQAFPLHLEMANGCGVASACVVALSCLNVLGNAAHGVIVLGYWPKPRGTSTPSPHHRRGADDRGTPSGPFRAAAHRPATVGSPCLDSTLSRERGINC